MTTTETNTAEETALRCPCCDAPDVDIFYRVDDVPVNSVLLLSSKDEAQHFPTGDIALGFCKGCGFVYNTAFDPKLTEYSSRYEETQGYSGTFQRWHRELAEDLIARYDLRNRRIIEIGCGKGEFLTLLCELGGNVGVGFDPAYVPERNVGAGRDRVEVVQDFYSDKYADVRGDFVCCKMTLEHIARPAEFVSTVRRALDGQPDTTVFFQVPDVRRILADNAFWDVYYEHCAYFSMGSLVRLFRRCGFEVLHARREYGDQYVAVEARPSGREGAVVDGEEDREELEQLVGSFREEVPRQFRDWGARLDRLREAGARVVVWGSGSKGVAFLTTLGGRPDIEYVVDINPNRHGYFMAGSGQEIVGPDFLTKYRPDTVVIMNPIYREEIVADLTARNLSPSIITA